MTKTNHPLIDLLNQNFLMITNYRGVVVSKVHHGISVLGKTVGTPEDVDKVIDDFWVKYPNGALVADKKQLSEMINNFNAYYEMSDSNDVYERGHDSKKEIEKHLAKITTEEKTKLISELNANGIFSYERYFKIV